MRCGGISAPHPLLIPAHSSVYLAPERQHFVVPRLVLRYIEASSGSEKGGYGYASNSGTPTTGMSPQAD